MDHVLRDLRYGLRLLGRAPVFAAVAILSLALGIGANAAIFQLIDRVRFRQLPVSQPERLAQIRADGVAAFGISEGFNSQMTYPLFEEIRAHQGAFASTFVWGNTLFLVGRGGDVKGTHGLWVSGEFFPALGIAPQLGRLLAPSDDYRGCGAESAVVSHAFWQSYFGGRESAIGSTLAILDRSFTVVGVTPPSFTGLEVGRTFDVALPVCSAALWSNSLDRRDFWWLTAMGRLKPDWTIARADDHLRALSPGLLDATVPAGYNAELLARYRSFRFGVVPADRGVSRLRDAHATSLTLLLGLTALVLLITCGNLATLMLARASARDHELAVRVAIGASRSRMVSQMVVESLLVAAAGAWLAVPLALISARALVRFLDTTANPVVLSFAADWRLLAFVSAAAIITVILFGLVPALRVSMVDPVAAMRQTSRGSTFDRRRARFQRGLVIGQVAISAVLIVSAVLFVRSFRNLTTEATGFEEDGLVAWSFLDSAAEKLPLEQRITIQRQLTDAIRSVPGVGAAAASTHVPLSGSTWWHFFRLPATGDADRKASRFAYVGPGYFETLNIPLLSGRTFRDEDDGKSRRVLVVNRSFVRTHLGSVDPMGVTLRTIEEAGYPETTYEIVGLVGDTKYSDLREEMPPIAYVPMAQHPDLRPWASVIVRSSGPVHKAITERATALRPGIAVWPTELKGQIREALGRERMIAWLAGAFGVLAIVLVTVGLYGIIAYLTVSRRREIGIRMALGATRTQIVRLVLRDNVWLLGPGLAIGLPLAAAITQSGTSLLFGLAPTDVPTLAAASTLLVATALVAGGIPAWRASKIRPEVALRCD